jgi:hypothetical protein
MSNLGWKAAAGIAGAASGWLARTGLSAVWRKAKGQEPPENPASRSTTWPEALVWAGASGVALAVARLVAQRGAAGLWRSATGEYPAAVRESGTAA